MTNRSTESRVAASRVVALSWRSRTGRCFGVPLDEFAVVCRIVDSAEVVDSDDDVDSGRDGV